MMICTFFSFMRNKISYICKQMRRIVLHIIFLLCFAWTVNAQNAFDMKLVQSVAIGDYNGVNTVLCADLDGDGLPEMATVQNDYRDNEGRIVIIKGGAVGRQNVIGFGAKYGTPGTSFGYSACPFAMTTTRDGAGRLQGNIYIVAGTAEAKNIYLYRYNSIDNIVEIASSPLQNNLYGIPRIADFNNDGREEVFVGTEVFDANSLTFIGFGGGDANTGRHLQHDGANFSYSTVYTVSKDRKTNSPNSGETKTIAKTTTPIETINEKYLLCGNQLFTVNPKAAPNGVILYKTLGETQKDGSALVADLDGDGTNEVVVRDTQKRLSIFSVKDNSALILNSSLPMSSLPAVGDIDGDGRDEIIGLKDANYLSAYKHSPEKNALYEFWTIRHSDVSAQTGITLFDFNSDGVEEIVYRDESLLRVINGSGKSHITGNDTIKNGQRIAYNLASVGLKSPTKSEKPVVCQALGGGETQIVIGGVLYGDYKPGTAKICIFGANTVPWALAPRAINNY